ncbi:MAG: hypothetical protein V4475_14500 [Pseudomonadota bacterium]
MTEVKLSYAGRLADNHVLEMYDGARALVGFQRSLALTAHLVANGEIITQAPALKNAQILTTTPQPGSWEVVATIVGGLWAVGTAGKDTPMGHLLFSVYDYVVSNTLGFHVDYSKSLGQSYGEYLNTKGITPEKLDSLIEKAESSISDMHRPIVASKSANGAHLIGYVSASSPILIGPEMSKLTYEYISHTVTSDSDTAHEGYISSYNVNTYKGRMFVIAEERPIPFELSDDARTRANVNLITSSLRQNAIQRSNPEANVILTGKRLESSTGRLKALIVNDVTKSQGN